MVCASLALVACDFHFDDFYAAAPGVAADASLPTSSGEAPATGSLPSPRDAAAGDGPGSTNDGASLPEAGQTVPAPVDAGPPQDPCVGAGAASCPCTPAACVAVDAGSPAAPPGGPPPAMMPAMAPIAPVTPTLVPTPGLRLRYDFAGQGATLPDRAGSAHGTLLGGAQLDGSGSLTLDGRDDYVTVPPEVLATIDSATLVAWVVSTTPTCWQRVFDIGNTLGTPGELMNDTLIVGELFLTSDACPAGRVTAIARNLAGRQEAQSTAPLPRNRPVQLAVVVDGMRQTVTLYIDGVRANETGSTVPLRIFAGGTFWLGRSLWQQDPHAKLRFDEFRLYDRALDAEQVAELARRGADVL